jgi:U6 snRNA-associated Sm-like protein LSm6
MASEVRLRVAFSAVNTGQASQDERHNTPLDSQALSGGYGILPGYSHTLSHTQLTNYYDYFLHQEKPMETTEQAKKKATPSDFLKSVLGRPVKVQLNSGLEYRGVLACLDGTYTCCDVCGWCSICRPLVSCSHTQSIDSFFLGYMNIAMEQTEEYSAEGQLMAKYGDCFIRGNNGTQSCRDTVVLEATVPTRDATMAPCHANISPLLTLVLVLLLLLLCC